MGAGYSSACKSTRAPPTVYTLSRNGTIVPQTSGKRPFNNAPIVKAEKLRLGGGFRNTFRKILSRCSFSPGWIRFECLLSSITELSHAVFGAQEQGHAQQQLELYITSPVKPLGMNVGDRVKQHDLRRYEVSASLCFVQTGGRAGKSATTVLLDSKSGPVDNAIWPMQVQDWRRFDSRRITLEAQLKALEAVERYLLGRREQVLMKSVEAWKLGVRDEDEEEEVYAEEDVGVDVDGTVKEVGLRTRTRKR